MIPSIALPTGPYDWHPERTPRDVFEMRLATLRAAMAEAVVTHAVVHGNCFDHDLLTWLTHFTPKLGPAYALVTSAGALRLLFAGGPGMKPSAQRLTWIEDVVAIRNVEGDIKRRLDDTPTDTAVRLGIVEGASMLRGDWLSLERVSGGSLVELDVILAKHQPDSAADRIKQAARVDEILGLAKRTLTRLAVEGADLRAAVIEMERAAYAQGAQDIRTRIARRPGALPTALPDIPLPMSGARQVVLAIRFDGFWKEARFIVGS